MNNRFIAANVWIYSDINNKNDKKFVVQYLDKAGAFLITKSGDKVSSLLGISKFTLYSYMDKQQ